MSGFAWRFRAPKSAAEHWRERRERRRRQLAREAAFPVTVAQVAAPDHLYECYQGLRRQGGPAPGVDGATYADLSNSEVGAILRGLSARVLEGAYRPQPMRPAPIPKPGTKEVRVLRIGVIGDRVVGKALHRALGPLWEGVFLDRSWDFRPGRGAWTMLAALEAQMVKQDRWVLAVDDLKNAFGTVPIHEAVACHQKMFGAIKPLGGKKNKARAAADKKKLLRLIRTVLRGSDPGRVPGIDQGAPYSPTCLNALLHYWLDEPLTSNMELPLWFRYADNACYLARSVPEGGQFLRKVRRLITPLGMTLKGKDGAQDLAKGKEVQLLGLTLRRQSNKVVYGLGKGALDRPAQDLGQAHATHDPATAARQTVFGWLSSAGPAFASGVTEIHPILRLAADYGFRGLASPDELRQHWEDAWTLWRDVRKQARHDRRP